MSSEDNKLPHFLSRYWGDEGFFNLGRLLKNMLKMKEVFS